MLFLCDNTLDISMRLATVIFCVLIILQTCGEHVTASCRYYCVTIRRDHEFPTPALVHLFCKFTFFSRILRTRLCFITQRMTYVLYARAVNLLSNSLSAHYCYRTGFIEKPEKKQTSIRYDVNLSCCLTCT